MIRTFITATAAAALLGGAALAGPVDDLVATLKAEGYTDIKVEVEVDGANTEIEGMLNGAEREIVVVTATGEVLSDKVEAEEDDNDVEMNGDDDADGDDDKS